MGRKKKQTNTVQTVSYQGMVKVSVADGKRIVSTQEYHNIGYGNLFKYLCYALQGSIVSDLRPNRLVLYNTAGDDPVPAGYTFPNTDIVSPAIMIDSEPVVKQNGTDWTCVLHFRVPYAYITSTAASVKALAVVKNNFDSEYQQASEELCASFRLDQVVQIESARTGNYSLIVEWTMTVKNAA